MQLRPSDSLCGRLTVTTLLNVYSSSVYNGCFLSYQATDPDANDYGEVQYSLATVDQDDKPLPFFLNKQNILSASKEFKRDEKRQFVFSVTAFDSLLDTSVRQSTETTVYVCS